MPHASALAFDSIIRALLDSNFDAHRSWTSTRRCTATGGPPLRWWWTMNYMKSRSGRTSTAPSEVKGLLHWQADAGQACWRGEDGRTLAAPKLQACCHLQPSCSATKSTAQTPCLRVLVWSFPARSMRGEPIPAKYRVREAGWHESIDAEVAAMLAGGCFAATGVPPVPSWLPP